MAADTITRGKQGKRSGTTELMLCARENGPDPRLIKLVRLLARRAARQVYEKQLKGRRTTRS